MKYASLASLAALAALAACGGSSPPPSPPSPPGLPTTGAEGIRGTVSILTGDFMPPAPSGAATPAAGAPVHVFAGAMKPVAAIDRGDAAYRGTLTTGADGTYQAALPPGTYTVVTEHDGAPYLNCFGGDGTWCTIAVTAGQWTQVDITDNSGATY